MPTAVVLSHADVAEELGHIGSWLTDEGYSVERVYRDDLPSGLRGDVLIALGSPESVADGHLKPVAAAEIALVRDWVNADRPYIGVCFGAQVLACATGGSVRRMPTTVRAYTPLELADEAPYALDGGWSVWHEDAITAPGDSHVMARLPHADAVFKVGRSWGIQPHIEFDSDIVWRLVQRMSVRPGGWEDLHEGLRADDEGHARRSRALMFAISETW